MTNVAPLLQCDDSESFREQFAANLHAALDHLEDMPRHHGRIKAAARVFGVSGNTMTGWLKGTSLPEIWRLPEIARKLDTTIDQLMTGDFATPSLINEQYAMISIHGQQDGEESQAIYALPETLQFMKLSRDMPWMRVESADMEGLVSVGDFVIYDPSACDIGTTSAVFVLSACGSTVIRRACRTLRGQIVLSCDHPHMPDEMLTDADFTEAKHDRSKIVVLGRVIGKMTQRT